MDLTINDIGVALLLLKLFALRNDMYPKHL